MNVAIPVGMGTTTAWMSCSATLITPSIWFQTVLAVFRICVLLLDQKVAICRRRPDNIPDRAEHARHDRLDAAEV